MTTITKRRIVVVRDPSGNGSCQRSSERDFSSYSLFDPFGKADSHLGYTFVIRVWLQNNQKRHLSFARFSETNIPND